MTIFPRVYPITGLFVIIDTKTGKIMPGAKGQRVFNSVSGSKTSARNTCWFQEWQRSQVLRGMGYGCLVTALEKAQEDAANYGVTPMLRNDIFKLQRICMDTFNSATKGTFSTQEGKKGTFSTQESRKVTFEKQSRFVVEDITSITTRSREVYVT